MLDRYRKKSSLRESYKDLNTSTISSYVKGFIRQVKKPYYDYQTFLEDLNSYLSPIKVTVEEPWEEVQWVSPDIAYGELWDDGSIHVGIDPEFQIDSINYSFENNEPLEKNRDFLQFLKSLGQVVIHEYTHVYQQVNRTVPTKVLNPSEVGEIRYLSSKDEIDAHATAGVQEARDIGYTDKQILDKLSGSLSSWELLNELDSTTKYTSYMSYPIEDPDEKKTWRRLVKRMSEEILKQD